MLEVSWVKCVSDKWCSLENVNLSGVKTRGVYIIWHAGNPGRVVRIGQGNIAERLQCHRTDEEVMAYKEHGLYVTWASVQEDHLDGVEKYLAETWRPLVGAAFPFAAPIAVNSPWG